MKRILLTMVLLWSGVLTAQRVTFSDLTVLANKRTWEEVKEILESKGWVFHKSSNEETVYQTVGWAYGKNQQDNKAKLWFSAYVLEGKLWGVNLQVNTRASFERIKNEAESEGFKKIESAVYTNGVSVFYMKGKNLLEMNTRYKPGEGRLSSQEYFHVILLKDINPERLCTEVKTGEHKGCHYLAAGGIEGLYTSYYLRGNKKRETNYTNGKINGEYKEFFNNGDVKRDLCYQDGKLEGWGTEYYFNGNKKSETFYKNNLAEGEYKDYYEDGSLKSEGTYKNGEFEGQFVEYYPDGAKKEELFFENGKQQGEHKFFYQDGTLFGKENFVDDKQEGNAIFYYPNGAKKIETFYKKGWQQGERKEYYENGTLESLLPYVDNKLEGWAKNYYANGNIKIETFYAKGMKNGEEKEYFISGNLRHIAHYEKDRYISKEYYSGGWKCVQRASGRERYEVMQEPIAHKNQFEYIDEEAQIKEVRSIKDGARHGKTIYYDLQTDKKLKEEKYDKGRLVK